MGSLGPPSFAAKTADAERRLSAGIVTTSARAGASVRGCSLSLPPTPSLPPTRLAALAGFALSREGMARFAAAIVLPLLLSAASAQKDPIGQFYREHQINLVVGSGPGGSHDIYARFSPVISAAMSAAVHLSWYRTFRAPAGYARRTISTILRRAMAPLLECSRATCRYTASRRLQRSVRPAQVHLAGLARELPERCQRSGRAQGRARKIN